MTFLPREILIQRIKNEVTICKKNLDYPVKVKDKEIKLFPIIIQIQMDGCPGPLIINDRITHIYRHKLSIIINEKYPYVRPMIKWESDIFHPNIMPGHEGGEVCSKLVDTWSFNSDLLSLIKGLESLLVNPNPKNPWGTDTCTRAAEYFNKNNYIPPVIISNVRKKPHIISRKHEDAKEEYLKWSDDD